MAQEYKVVPAPRQGEKAKGVKTTADRFALALSNLMNQMAAEGWEYLRADTLPCEEVTGLTRRVSSSFQSVLVFHREKSAEAPRLMARLADPGVAPTLSAPTSATPEAEPAAAPRLGPADAPPPEAGAPRLGPAD